MSDNNSAALAAFRRNAGTEMAKLADEHLQHEYVHRSTAQEAP